MIDLPVQLKYVRCDDCFTSLTTANIPADGISCPGEDCSEQLGANNIKATYKLNQVMNEEHVCCVDGCERKAVCSFPRAGQKFQSCSSHKEKVRETAEQASADV